MGNELTNLDDNLLKQVANDFNEHTDQSEIRIPRIKIIQKNSTEMDDDSLDLKQGMIINELSKRVYEKPLLFVPIKKQSFWIRFNAERDDDPAFDPEFSPGAFMYIKDTAIECGDDAKWINGRRLASRVVAFLSYLPDYADEGPVMITFKGRTGERQANVVSSIIKLRGNIPFRCLFELTTLEEESNGRKYQVASVKDKGKPSDDIVITCADIYREMSARVDAKNFENQSDSETIGDDKQEDEINWE